MEHLQGQSVKRTFLQIVMIRKSLFHLLAPCFLRSQRFWILQFKRFQHENHNQFDRI